MRSLILAVLAIFFSHADENQGIGSALDKLGFSHWNVRDYSCRKAWNIENKIVFPANTNLEKANLPNQTTALVSCADGTIEVRFSEDYIYEGKKIDKKFSFVIKSSPSDDSTPYSYPNMRSTFVGDDPKTVWPRLLPHIIDFLPVDPSKIDSSICEGNSPERKNLPLRKDYANLFIGTQNYEFPAGTTFDVSCDKFVLTYFPSKDFVFSDIKFFPGSKFTAPGYGFRIFPSGNKVEIEGQVLENAGVITNKVTALYHVASKPNDGNVTEIPGPVKVEHSVRNQTFRRIYAPKEGLPAAGKFFFEGKLDKIITDYPFRADSGEISPGATIWLDPSYRNYDYAKMAYLYSSTVLRGITFPKQSRLVFDSTRLIAFVPGEDFTQNGIVFKKDVAYSYDEGNIHPTETKIYFSGDGGLATEDDREYHQRVRKFETMKDEKQRPVISWREWIEAPTLITVFGQKGVTLGFIEDKSLFCGPLVELQYCERRASFTPLKNVGEFIGFIPYAHIYTEYEPVVFKKSPFPKTAIQGNLDCTSMEGSDAMSWRVDLSEKSIRFSNDCSQGKDNFSATEPILGYETFKDVEKYTTNAHVYYFLDGSYVSHTEVGEPSPVTHRMNFNGETELLTWGRRDGNYGPYIHMKSKYIDPTVKGC